MNDYASRRAFSDQFLPKIKALLGAALIEEATFEEDTKLATDLVMPSLRISVRVRKSNWVERFGNEFTLRAYSGGSSPTEYSKLMDMSPRGAEYLIYCFVNDSNEIIRAWLININRWNVSCGRGEVKPTFFKNQQGHSVVTFPCHPSYSKLLVGN